MRFDEESLRTHARLAEANRQLLESVEGHPELLERARFASLERNLDLLGYRLQPWPLFVDAAAVSEIGAMMAGLTRLLKSVPERFFGNDPEILADYYGQDEKTAKLCATLFGQPGFLDTLLARGDFLENASGFQCMEVNLSSNLGGWQSLIWETLYLEAPPLAAFLRDSGLRVAARDTIRVLIEHVVEHALRKDLGHGGELNLLFALTADELDRLVLRDMVSQVYSRYLRETHGLEGQVLVARFEELESRSDELYLGDCRAHIVIEQYRGWVPRPVLFASLSGNALLINGTVTRILDDRRNLALLSEHQDSEYFADEERALIRRFVPWTRVVTSDFTDYAGARSPLPALLAGRQEDLVLKHVFSMGGEQVRIGAAMPRQAWEAAVEQALAEEGRWIAQELIHPVRYWRQTGASGCAPHDLVWGLFTFGDRYGGGFLRMKRSGTPALVNSAQGAEESIIFEIRS